MGGQATEQTACFNADRSGCVSIHKLCHKKKESMRIKSHSCISPSRSCIKFGRVDNASAANTDYIAKRGVTFSRKRRMREVPHINDFSDKMVQKSFYSRDDYARFRSTISNLVKTMNNEDSCIENENESCRGLEFRTQAGLWERFERKNIALEAVMTEQLQQSFEGVTDSSKISYVYMKVNEKSKLIALEQAKKDEHDIQEYLQDVKGFFANQNESCCEEQGSQLESIIMARAA